MMKKRSTIIKKEFTLSPSDIGPYKEFTFFVPKNTGKVGVYSFYERKNAAPRIYLALFDPHNFRGNQMSIIEEGRVEYDLWVANNSSALGCIPGNIPEGEWRIQFDISKLERPTKIFFEVYREEDGYDQTPKNPFFDKRIIKEQSGWFCGELHAHSNESDGAFTVGELIKNANQANLDFLSITDHFTISQWWRVEESDLGDTLLINASEITSQCGHANIHGIQEWVDVFIDRKDWNANHAAEETHKQGGLFCVNHAFSSDLGWRHFDLDWNNVDLFEIYHSLEGPNNISQIGMYDSLLREGYRIIGISGTDCHNPNNEIEKLGRVVTWVYANELSIQGIINGLKQGKVFVSLGPKMDFHIQDTKGSISEMGGKITSDGQPLTLIIDVESTTPLRAMIIKNGFFLESIIVNPNQEKVQTIEFVDNHPIYGYYRVELHEIFNDEEFSGIEWRDFRTIKALSNPIWVD